MFPAGGDGLFLAVDSKGTFRCVLCSCGWWLLHISAAAPLALMPCRLLLLPRWREG